jgi:hypothetical protein
MDAAGIAPAASVYQMVLTIASVQPLVSDLIFGHPDTSRPCVSCARRSDDTEARQSQGEQATARERPQAGTCRPAMMDAINLAEELRHSIETGEPDPCQLGSQVGRDKGRNALKKALR